jgi:hypothetical protein
MCGSSSIIFKITTKTTKNTETDARGVTVQASTTNPPTKTPTTNTPPPPHTHQNTHNQHTHTPKHPQPTHPPTPPHPHTHTPTQPTHPHTPILGNMETDARGVTVQASTLGALEALLEYLRKECKPPVPVARVRRRGINRYVIYMLLRRRGTDDDYLYFIYIYIYVYYCEM